MNWKTRYLLRLQRFLGRLSIFVIAPLTHLFVRVMGYRVRDLRRARRTIRDLFKEHGGAWIICPNHLTMIDSIILQCAMAPLHGYMIRYRRFPWNLPERANFQKNIFLTVVCYLSKCIPISRGGDRGKIKSILDRCVYLLKKRESLIIFPEGGRSRTGRVDVEKASYGVGRLVANASNCRVMCMYLRGDGQETYGGIPRFGEHFTMQIEAFKPEMEGRGLKAQRDCARQIVGRLARMEEEYFDRKRHRGSYGPSGKREKSGYPLHGQGVHAG
ncbi:MAG: 1-acyl-sn-glycerol-3-phosphate acyltransferase [Syntrophobacterales bacterium]|nr:MAG: 1-acyl-sn-glycerol-3-phosphate acyltransferase [Syntrophobacterales bacterium]